MFRFQIALQHVQRAADTVRCKVHAQSLVSGRQDTWDHQHCLSAVLQNEVDGV